MSVIAVQGIRAMRGRSQSKLMLCADERLWVVKFQNNPLHIRVLANELIAARLAEAVGITVPETDIVIVSEALVSQDSELMMELPRGRRVRYLPGQQLGSVFVCGSMQDQAVDFLEKQRLRRVRNLSEFAGMLAFDKWVGNCDGRQAVYTRGVREKRYRAIFIDQGSCFNEGKWNFPDAPLSGVHACNSVYEGVVGWENFEPWISRIEAVDAGTLWRIAEAVPPLWYGFDVALIQSLMNKLLQRRSRVRELIMAFRDSDRKPFPMWEIAANS